MYRVQSMGAFLVDKDGNKLKLGDGFYSASDLNGKKSISHRVVIKNTDTGEVKTLFPGEFISIEVPKKKRTRKKKDT